MSARTGLPLVLVLLSGCLSLFGHSECTKGVLRTYDMKNVIIDHVPLGTSLARARRFMENEGFKCELHTNDSFVDGYVLHSGVDYLLCKRTDRVGPEFVEVNWEVAIALSDETVGDVWPINDLQELPDLPVTTPYSRLPRP